jgi:hypothetical protein
MYISSVNHYVIYEFVKTSYNIVDYTEKEKSTFLRIPSVSVEVSLSAKFLYFHVINLVDNIVHIIYFAKTTRLRGSSDDICKYLQNK